METDNRLLLSNEFSITDSLNESRERTCSIGEPANLLVSNKSSITDSLNENQENTCSIDESASIRDDMKDSWSSIYSSSIVRQPVRQHYFWPLICDSAKRGQTQGEFYVK